MRCHENATVLVMHALQLSKGACLPDDFFNLPLFLSLGNQQTGIGLFPVSLCFLKTLAIAEIWGLLCRNVLSKMLHPHENRLVCGLFAGFAAGGKANMWQSRPASAAVPMGDVCPMDYYGNEVTQMFRKKIKKKPQQNKMLTRK